jgi:hypothetical protein
MIRKLLRSLCALVLLAVVAMPGIAQPPQVPNQQPQQPPFQPVPAPGQPQSAVVTDRRPPAAEYAIAIVATLGILVIVCMPSRKR